VILLSPFASADPDGLERVAQNLGFINAGRSSPFELLPDYSIPFLGETGISTIVAGVVGAVLVLSLLILLGRNLRKTEDS